jgi:hypothetical protein
VSAPSQYEPNEQEWAELYQELEWDADIEDQFDADRVASLTGEDDEQVGEY